MLGAGCGGGFDFCHSGLLYPFLKSLNKTIVILSYSFGVTSSLDGEPVYSDATTKAVAKLVTAATRGAPNYQPEVGYCAFLDAEYARDAPHSMYACYAREWPVPRLAQLYAFIAQRHAVDALLLIDGGTDSLMKGDEDGLGDPLEDACSLGAAALLAGVGTKLLVSVGFGADRFNGVSDEDSLAAVAELTRLGAFLGSHSVEPSDAGFDFYRRLLKTIYRHAGRERGRERAGGDTRFGAHGAASPANRPFARCSRRSSSPPARASTAPASCPKTAAAACARAASTFGQLREPAAAAAARRVPVVRDRGIVVARRIARRLARASLRS